MRVRGVWCTVLCGGRQEFISAITREKEEKERLFALSERKKKVSGVLDPLTKSLKNYEDQEDLLKKIDHMYSKLDIDGSGGACLSLPPHLPAYPEERLSPTMHPPNHVDKRAANKTRTCSHTLAHIRTCSHTLARTGKRAGLRGVPDGNQDVSWRVQRQSDARGVRNHHGWRRAAE